MSTLISWSDEVWNPTTGCDRVSPGCANCYALHLAGRYRRNPKMMALGIYQKDGGRASGPGFGLTLRPEVLEKPLHWKQPKRIFVNSMSDLFHEDIPDEFIDQVFAVMALCWWHTFQILTKRIERALAYLRTWARQFDLDGNLRWREPGNWEGPAVQRIIPLMAASEAGLAWRAKNPHGDILPKWPLDNVLIGPTVARRARLRS